ncbi:MAG: hypothetical protein JOZ99_00620, partial [Actinobacteria bacterium]|nr:hypothetical protein [Actinomycetota bacterium]
ASGQYVHGFDAVPRGHPGDGRIEVQVYAQAPRERAGMRRRLPLGTHVPHPGIVQAVGHAIAVTSAAERTLEVDGEQRGRARTVTVEVRAGALRLLI